MIYHISEYLQETFNIEWLQAMGNISTRAILAVIFSLFIAIVFGEKIIKFLQRKQIGEEVRDLGLKGEEKKRNTPTMGGVIIILAFIVPVLLFANLENIYIQVMLFSTIWIAIIGLIDDYIKVFKKDKSGLSGRYKLLGQAVLGIIVGLTMWANDNIVVRENIPQSAVHGKVAVVSHDIKSTITTIPFTRDNILNYNDLVPFEGDMKNISGWIIYVLIATLVIASVSNGANLTDGLDGLAAGTSSIIAIVLVVFAYLSGNAIYSQYLDIMYIPGSGELVIFGMAFVGALIGFLWYNCSPAQVFMGDTGSLTIGAVIAVFALLIRKELLLPLLCFIFLVESVSVMLQVGYFKYTKKKMGEGRRIFLMAPLHHHFQKQGYSEMKIVMRFCIIQLLLAAFTVITLKMI